MKLPETIWVIVRSTGEYSDRIETPIRYCLSEQEAEDAVRLIGIEKQRDKPPVCKRISPYAYRMPDGRMFPDDTPWQETRDAEFVSKPDCDEIEKQNEIWHEEYVAKCQALGHVDPEGSWRGDEYYISAVTLWPAKP